ncbi:MAG TPA: gfo/Idh/MocA family oxidoreductase, partial [Chloroflexota bacterium]|nr:gfo/Idh/MocA family oxidoreductase [Chloroflexota bacterium]
YGESQLDVSAHGWGLSDFNHAKGHQRFYGLTIVSGDKGEMRQSPDGILLYGDEAIEEIAVERGLFGRQAEITELYNAVVHGQPMFHDGRWGEATLEVCLAILQSAAERKEIQMKHQVPVGD